MRTRIWMFPLLVACIVGASSSAISATFYAQSGLDCTDHLTVILDAGPGCGGQKYKVSSSNGGSAFFILVIGATYSANDVIHISHIGGSAPCYETIYTIGASCE